MQKFVSKQIELNNLTPLWTTFVRYARQTHLPKSWEQDEVKYKQVSYYPRFPDHKDPPITPSKLLLLHRVKPFKGNPYWDKNILTQLGFCETKNNPVIVKNTPEICALLWRIKHLIRVTPIKLPEKLPNPDDLGGCYLHENGTFSVTPKIDSSRLQATKTFLENPKIFDREEISEKLRLQWLRGNLD